MNGSTIRPKVGATDVRSSCIHIKYFQIVLAKAGVSTVMKFVQKPSNSIVVVSYVSKYVHFLSLIYFITLYFYLLMIY